MLRLLVVLLYFLLFTQTVAVAGVIEPFFNEQIANEEIKSVSVSRDGEYIAIAAYESHLTIEAGNEIIKIFNDIYFFNKSGVKIWDTQIYNGIINDIATNGEYVVVGYSVEKGQFRIMRGYVRLYSKSKEIIFDKEIEPVDNSFSNPTQYVAISPNGVTIAASDSNNVYLLDKSGSIIKRIPINGYITGMAFSLDFVAVSFGDTVSFYDNIGRLIQSLKVENAAIKGISISDNRHIAILTQKTIFLYNNSKKLWEKSAKVGSVFSSITMSQDGNWIAASTTNDGLLFFNKNGEEALKNPTFFKKVATNGDLIAGTRSASLYLFNINPFIKGSISVSSTQGAEVYLDDKFVGMAPITIPDVPVGSHTIKIVKQGYESWIQNISISYGEKKEISVMLAASPIMPTLTPPITQTIAPSPTPIPTPTSDVIVISKNAILYIMLVVILIAMPSIVYLKNRNLKRSTYLHIKVDSKIDPFIGGNCPYCGDLIKANSKITICPDCETPHHRECWEKHGGCTTFGCKSAP